MTWLDRRYSNSMEFLGTSSGWAVADKLRASGLTYRTVGSPAVPRIEEAAAYLLCHLERVQNYGDHQLVVGRVREAKAVEDFDEYWEFRTYSPMLYTGLGRDPLKSVVRRRGRRDS